MAGKNFTPEFWGDDDSQEIRLADLTDEITGAAPKEMSEKEKALIKMAYVILGGITVLLAIGSGLYIFTGGTPSELSDEMSKVCSELDTTQMKIENACNVFKSAQYKNDSAKDVFDFFKTFFPPIITLVLGALFVKNREQDDS